MDIVLKIFGSAACGLAVYSYGYDLAFSSTMAMTGSFMLSMSNTEQEQE